MKKLTLTTAAIFLALSTIAQESADADTLWKFSGITSLNLSQLSLTNWAAGGENSLSGNALVQVSADYDNGTLNWDNDLVPGIWSDPSGQRSHQEKR